MIPHSVDAVPSGAIEYPQTMFPDGDLNAPYRGAASLSMYECRVLMTNPFPLALKHFSPAALEVHLKTPNWRVVP